MRNLNKLIWVLVIVVVIIAGVMLSGKTYKAPVAPTSTTTQAPVQKDQEATVEATANGFVPQALTVKVGTKVVWVNKSGTTVTANSSPHPTHTDYPPLNLGAFDNGSSVELVFDKAGTYKYHNHLNPTQFGSITVIE